MFSLFSLNYLSPHAQTHTVPAGSVEPVSSEWLELKFVFVNSVCKQNECDVSI